MEDDGLIVFVEEKSGKCRFQHFRHQKWFKILDGKISVRRAMAREIWFWD